MSLVGLEPKYGGRRRTVYDAVAGRVRQLNRDSDRATIDDGLRRAIAPDDILLDSHRIKEEGVPIPFEDHPDLPDDDLLVAIHYYASNYFKELRPELVGTYSEDLLLAMGIVMEEEIKKMIGPNGHLVFAKDKELGDTEGESALGQEHIDFLMGDTIDDGEQPDLEVTERNAFEAEETEIDIEEDRELAGIL